MAAPLDLHPEALRLQPFDPATAPMPLRLGASLRRQGARLEIRWNLQGDLAQLRLPEPTAEPQRRDALWTSTCLECFLARPGDAGYWELNLCPSGHWNLYRLDGYRRGLRPELAIQRLPSQRRPSRRQPSPEPSCEPSRGPRSAAAEAGEEQELELAIALDLAALLGNDASDAPLELGVTAVLAATDGAISYWALVHPGPAADFHHRDAFCVRLPGSRLPAAQG